MKKTFMYTTIASLTCFLYSLQANATFPCSFESPTVPIDSQTFLGFSGEEALSHLLADSNPISLKWYYETPTTRPDMQMVASVSFTPSHDTVTVHRDLGGEDCYAIETMLVIEGNLELQINDMGINALCPAKLVVTEDYGARLQTDTGRVNSSGPIGEYCEALAQLPGPSLSNEHGTSLFIDILNGEFDGEIMRDYFIPRGAMGTEFRVQVIGSIGEGLGYEWLKPGYSVEGKTINR